MVKKQKSKPSFLFNEETHQYYINNRNVPGVTSILQDNGILDFSKVPKNVLYFAKERGKRLHQALDYFDRNILDLKSADPTTKRVVNAYAQFKDDYGFIPQQIEIPIFSLIYGYGGKPDRIGIITKGRWTGYKIVLDFKTGMLLPAVQLQTAAYKQAYNELFPSHRVSKRVALTFNKDRYNVKFLEEKSDFSTFLACLQVKNFKVHNGICN